MRVEAGFAVFERDIVDVIGMDFPLVEIGEVDRVVCLFRQDWSFGLYFDFNPDGDFDRNAMARALGTLHRTLRYRHLYEVVGNQPLLAKLMSRGWFPFAEIISSDFKELAAACEADFDLDESERLLMKRFDQKRLESIFDRWMTKSHFQPKREILRAAVNSHLAGEPVAVIKIVLTEIEGILANAYRAKYGKGTKIKELLSFAVQSAEEKTGEPNSLLFSAAFAKYLSTYTFSDFDPEGPPGQAGSRHAVGHGAAEAESYTTTRALQALLTLDQIGFYT